VRALLAYGAKLRSVPQYTWKDYIATIDSNAALPEEDVPEAEWCAGIYRKKLAATLTCSQRYFLNKASRREQPTIRQMQIAREQKMTALLEVPYHLIGQEYAPSRYSEK